MARINMGLQVLKEILYNLREGIVVGRWEGGADPPPPFHHSRYIPIPSLALKERSPCRRWDIIVP